MICSARRILGVALIAVGASSARAQTGQPTVVLTKIDYGPGDIAPVELQRVALRVDSLKFDIPTIRVRVGETFSLDTMAIVAYDSNGTRIGRLRSYDVHPPRGAFRSAGLHQYVPVAEGSIDMAIAFPRIRWTERSDPPAQAILRVEVLP